MKIEPRNSVDVRHALRSVNVPVSISKQPHRKCRSVFMRQNGSQLIRLHAKWNVAFTFETVRIVAIVIAWSDARKETEKDLRRRQK